MYRIALLILVGFLCQKSSSQDFKELPNDFSTNAYRHINKLCDIGIRRHDESTGTETIGYLQGEFDKIGLEVTIDTFNFNWVHLKNRSVILNGDSVKAQSILINQNIHPELVIAGECKFLDGYSNPGPLTRDKIIFSSRSNNTLLAKKYNPKAIVILRDDDFSGLKTLDDQQVELILPEISTLNFSESYNLIATYTSYDKTKKDILLTAHWDSENGPGADDNASGVSLLIELSKYFKEYQQMLPYNLKFIATGAEEIGLIGSKAYILKYAEDVVENCQLNFNIDAIAGGRKPYIEMRNPIDFKNYDDNDQLEIISIPDSNIYWYTSFLEVYRNSASEAIYPNWLIQDIKTAMKSSKIKFYNASCCSGADHRSFAYLNLPSIYLTSTKKFEKNLHHTPNDIPKEDFKTSLGLTGKTVQRILIEICMDSN